jgi:phenylpropionate dioxygenase-like ring-hydroxylating dioxygenase large terminal subunit
MHKATQIALVHRAFAHIDAGTTDLAAEVTRNPTRVYTDPEWLAREQGILFRKYPLFMGLSGRLAEPGAYVAEPVAGLPVLLTRGDDGRARAFVNLCRHRGAPLAQGCGRSAGFSCPYHAWRYDREGRLIAIPDQRSFPGIDRENRGLIPLPLLEKDGMLWLLPEPGTPLDDSVLDNHLQGLGAELSAYEFGGYSLYRSEVFERDANWKMPIDTFLEAYHFATLHRNTVAPIFFPNLCLFDAFGLNHREAVIRRSIEELREQPEAQWDFVRHTAISYQLFPNTVLVMQGDHVETWRLFPAGDRPDRCVVQFDCYVPEPPATAKAHRYWEANIDLALRTVDEEDIAMQVNMEAGYLSGLVDEVLIGRNEPALAHFQRAVHRAVAGD